MLKALFDKLSTVLPLFQEQSELLNSINYFPVPDNDTGTNMYDTLSGAIAEYMHAGKSFKWEHNSAAALFIKYSKGNSGVILASVLSEFILSCAVHIPFYESLMCCSRKAYQAVLRPKEGTILTFLRLIAEESAKEKIVYPFSEKSKRQLADIMKQAVEQTKTDLNDGGYDSGAVGLYFLICMLCDLSYDINITPGRRDNEDIRLEYKYCTEVKVENVTPAETSQIIDRIQKYGDSINYVIMPNGCKVHIHTNLPCFILRIFAEKGIVTEVKIDNMKLEASTKIKPFEVICVLDYKNGEEVFDTADIEYAVITDSDCTSLRSKISKSKCGEIILLNCDAIAVEADKRLYPIHADGYINCYAATLCINDSYDCKATVYSINTAISCIKPCGESDAFNYVISGQDKSTDDSNSDATSIYAPVGSNFYGKLL